MSTRFNDLAGLLFYYAKDYNQALQEYEEGIHRISDNDILMLGFSANNYQITTLLRQKNWVYEQQNKLNPTIKKQQQIINNLLLMESFWDRFLQDQVINIQDIMTDMYNENPYPYLFQAYVKMYELTGDAKYQEKIHEYNEKSKYNALLLMASLTPNQEKEKQVLYNKRKAIHLLYDEYMLAKNNLVPNSNLLKTQLVAQIKNYNSYEATTSLFQKSKTVTITEIQNNLTNKDAVVSYSNDANMITNNYAEIITKNNFKIEKVNPITELWAENGFQENDIITNEVFKKGIANFKIYGNELYKMVFKNVENHLPKAITHIEIIPNTILSNIPFEMLLTADTITTDYRKLPYLMRKYSFSYSLSASISQFNTTKQRANVNKNSIFTPSFDGQQLSKLALSKGAAENIAKEYNMTLFEGKKASIPTFKTTLQDNKVITIFSHGKSFNDLENNKKGIYFSDGFLSINAIYKLKTNCDLLILGTCESGFGYKEKGEGNISLVRPFSSIGVKSMVLASWKIDEASSVTIIHSFLKYLSQGNTKSEALQKAKLDFLATASPTTANPIYWAGLTITGNNETIEFEGKKYWHWWYLVFTLPFIAFWYFKRSRS